MTRPWAGSSEPRIQRVWSDVTQKLHFFGAINVNKPQVFSR